jgi:hypothetical protein
MTDTSPRPTATPTPSPTVPAPRAGTDYPGMAASPAAPPTQRTAWAGWVGFAACMMFFVAAFQIVEGLVAIFDRTYYQVSSSHLVVHVNYTGWGWAHLLVGVVIGLSAAGVLVGNVLARTVGVILASVSALLNLLFMAAYPVWGVILIAVDILVIYALIAHGRELRQPVA